MVTLASANLVIFHFKFPTSCVFLFPIAARPHPTPPPNLYNKAYTTNI